VDIRTQKLLEKFSELFEEVLSKKEREIMTV
jgi:ribosome recycling factor